MKIIKQWNNDDSKFIANKVIEYNMSKLPQEVKTPSEYVSFVLKNENEELVGGITATIYWHHIYIDFLWVEESHREGGYGSELMNKIEELAIEKGCYLILLDTFSFQAPDFYKKLGYKVVGTVEDHPKGFNKYLLEKRL